MFTGIIEEVGQVENLNMTGVSGKISIHTKTILQDVNIGDSIAVNGVCLTVTSLGSNHFCADIMPETMHRSNLGELTRNDQVNLERAMAAGGRFGGHIVSGHIDGTGIISEYRKDENAVWVKIKTSEDILKLIIEKGSIAIDGISLTVAKVHQDSFEVSVIPHTGKETTLLGKKVGNRVNLENDVIGKYVQRLMDFEIKKKEKNTTLTYEMLETLL